MKRLLSNRVVWGAVLFCLIAAVWQFGLKPQYRPIYEQGVAQYRNGQYNEALTLLQRAYDIDPNAVDVVVLLGWTQYKLQRMEEARYYFGRALQLEPHNEEATIGAAFVGLNTGQPRVNLAAIVNIDKQRGGDPDLQMLIAQELRRQGRYQDALRLLESLITVTEYKQEALSVRNEILGLDGFDDPVTGLAPLVHPATLQVRTRAAAGSMWRSEGSTWAPYYVQGVDLGPGAPNHSPGDPPTDGRSYVQWLAATEQLHANVIRVYTLLPPAFYRAFQHHVRTGSSLQLYQQIWVGDPPNKNLYDPAFSEECRREIRYVIDALHGRGDVPPRRARGSGLYTTDVAAQVGGILFGRELEPSVVQQTNSHNPGKDGYDGRFLAVSSASPTEVWFAEMLDYLVSYETDTYNWQHPVGIVNWPPLDPLVHRTESSTLEEVTFRRARGEALALPQGAQDDNDVVAIDEAKFRATAQFAAGLFASYHVYPYYPDFLLLDPNYLRVRDAEGPNPMLAYLQELRSHIPHPLVITEFGVPSSIGISHFHPFGLHHGGHSEQRQAEIMARLARSIRASGCAGGIAFELIDEWYKHNWLAVDFEGPEERQPLWLNELDPEKRYGLLGYETGKAQLFAAGASAWGQERALYTLPEGSGSDLPGLQVAADEAFLYLRLQTDRSRRANHTRGTAAGSGLYAVAINTLPGQAGVKNLPFGNVSLASGANFLLLIGDPSSSKLLIADNYNPYEIHPDPHTPGHGTLSYRAGFTPRLQDRGSFVDLVVETNRPRFGRDGTLYAGRRYSRSDLRYAAGAPKAATHDSAAEWYVDGDDGSIIVRLAWGKLLVTDPSRREVFFGFRGPSQVRSTLSAGFEFSVFELGPSAPASKTPSSSLIPLFPASTTGEVNTPGARFTWPLWDKVETHSYLKKAFYALRETYLAEYRAAHPALDSRHRLAGRRSHERFSAAGQ